MRGRIGERSIYDSIPVSATEQSGIAATACLCVDGAVTLSVGNYMLLSQITAARTGHRRCIESQNHKNKEPKACHVHIASIKIPNAA